MFNNKQNNGRRMNKGSEGKTASLCVAMLLGLAALAGGCDEAGLAAGIAGVSDDGWYDGGYWDGGYYDDSYGYDDYGGYDAGDAIETYLGNYVVY